MAQLPGGRYLIDRFGPEVILFERDTEAEIIRFDPADRDATAKAQAVIHARLDLTDEERAFAHFWSGYFYAYARNES